MNKELVKVIAMDLDGTLTQHKQQLDNENKELYNKYLEDAKEYKNLFLLGRLGNYKYINLDQAVEDAIELLEKITGEEVDVELIKETKISRGV